MIPDYTSLLTVYYFMQLKTHHLHKRKLVWDIMSRLLPFHVIFFTNSIAFYLQGKLGIKKHSTKCSHLLSGGDIQMQLEHLSQRPIFAGPFSFTFPLLPLFESEFLCSILQRRQQQKCNINHFVLLMASLDNESVILDWKRYCSNAISSASITELGF